MKYKDQNGKEGRYSGDVNEEHEPHGQGKMKYKDGTVFSGVWSDGVAVHGKSSSGHHSSSKEKKERSSKKEQWSNAPSGGSNKVRKMKWMDYYGDPGEYTGEVDEDNMPNGKGSMKYDHGLIQEGLWSKGQFVEGSDAVEQKGGEKTRQREGGSSSGSRRKEELRRSKGNMDP
jgi:hypothetical protein